MALTWLTGSPGVDEPWELPHSAQEDWANDKLTATVHLIATWSQRYTVMENILGNSLPWPYHAAGTPLRATHGVIGSFSGEASIEDAAFAPGGNKFSLTDLTVNFETVSATEGEGTVIYSESIEPTAEYLSVPTDKLHWGSVSGEKVSEPPGFLQPGFDYKVTYYNIDGSTIPPEFVTLTGKCNSAAVPTSMFGDLAAETALYNPPTMTRSVSFGSSNRWTLSMRLTYKPNTWNKHFRPSSGAYEYMYHADGGGSPLKPVTPASFAAILPDGL